MAEFLRSFGRIRADEDGDSARVTAIISTGDIARDGAIIDPTGWDFSDYERNPVVLYGHDDGSGGMFAAGSGAMPVARTVEGPTAGKNEITATAEFDRDDEVAMRLLGKIRRGFINATSVRWLPIRTEWVEKEDTERHEGEDKVLVFREQKLLEWSFVPIPADPGAVIQRSDGGVLDLDEFREGGKPNDNDRAGTHERTTVTRDELLDELDYLKSGIERYGIEALANRMRDPAHAALIAAVHAQLGEVIAGQPARSEPQPTSQGPFQGAETLLHMSEVETGIREITEMLKSRPSVDELVPLALAQATGRSVDEFRRTA